MRVFPCWLFLFFLLFGLSFVVFVCFSSGENILLFWKRQNQSKMSFTDRKNKLFSFLTCGHHLFLLPASLKTPLSCRALNWARAEYPVFCLGPSC